MLQDRKHKKTKGQKKGPNPQPHIPVDSYQAVIPVPVKKNDLTYNAEILILCISE